MKSKKIIIALLIPISLLIIAYILGRQYGSPRIKGHLYLGDHITININIHIDGTELPLSDLTLTCNDGAENVTVKDGSYKIRGGNYGMYLFELIIPAGSVEGLNNDISLDMDYINANSWYIVDINNDILLSKAPEGYKGTVSIDAHFNDGRTDQFTNDISTDSNNRISVTWGV